MTICIYVYMYIYIYIAWSGWVHMARGQRMLRQIRQRYLLTRFFLTLVTVPRRSLSLKLSDTRVYEPQILPPHQVRVFWLMIDSGLGGVLREQKMLKGHLPRVI